MHPNQLGQDMDRKTDPIIKPPSITDPAAEEARKHLSWSPGEDAPDGGYDEEPATLNRQRIDEAHEFVSYTGYPDGSFEVQVTLERWNTAATQSERGMGEKMGDIDDAALKAYEKADRALSLLARQPLPDSLDEEGQPR